MVPTIPLAELTEAQKRAYILADNRLAENAGWDQNCSPSSSSTSPSSTSIST